MPKEPESDLPPSAVVLEDGQEKPFQFTSFEEIQRVIIGENNDYDRGFMQNFVSCARLTFSRRPNTRRRPVSAR